MKKYCFKNIDIDYIPICWYIHTRENLYGFCFFLKERILPLCCCQSLQEGGPSQFYLYIYISCSIPRQRRRQRDDTTGAIQMPLHDSGGDGWTGRHRRQSETNKRGEKKSIVFHVFFIQTWSSTSKRHCMSVCLSVCTECAVVYLIYTGKSKCGIVSDGSEGRRYEGNRKANFQSRNGGKSRRQMQLLLVRFFSFLSLPFFFVSLAHYSILLSSPFGSLSGYFSAWWLKLAGELI